MTDVPSNTPADAEPPESRFSIGHLLIGVACVAIFMSIERLLTHADLPEQDTLDTVIRAASGVFSGLALAGLLLLISRRIRHQKFPRSGGEIIWVMDGIGVVFTPTVNVLVGAGYGWFFVLETLAYLLVWAPIFTYAILATRRHWRMYFMVHLSGAVVWYLTCNSYYFTGYSLDNYYFHGIPVTYIIYPCRLIVETFALALVAWLDLRSSDQRYPWPHWVGNILILTGGIVWLAYWVIYLHDYVLLLRT